MRVTTFIAIGLAALVTAAGASATARAGRGIEYSFFGQLNAAPAGGQLSLTVQRGNRAALRAMLGQSVSQTFTYGSGTEFLKWSHGIPSVVQAGDLASGDFVWIHVRAAAGASLAVIEQKDLSLVGDYGTHLKAPRLPLYLFRGKLTGTGSSSVTLTVHGGNRRATRLLIGQPKSETFTVSGSTIFLLWQGKVPTVISLAQLKVGDTIAVRIRAKKGSTLAQVESTPAVHVNDREPPPAAQGVRYSFFGQVTAVPANGQLSITVEQGNRPALRAMLGQPVLQTFAYGSSTEFLKWSQGKPTVVQAGDLAVNDFVWVHVRDSVGASLADIETKDAGLVGDHGAQFNPPSRPLYLFRGKLTATGSTSVTLNVHGGNARAMRLLVGQPTSETFTVGANTIFLLWQGKVPTVISLGELKIGDSVVVRIRAKKGSTLAQVESTAAAHVGDREPAGSA
jgi:hypothetical protein